jgi:hypothetical protein
MIARATTLLACGTLLACTRDDPTGAQAPPPGELAVEGSTLVPTVHRITFTTETPSASWVEYDAGDGVLSKTPVGAEGTDHEHVLLGLKAGRTYTWRAVAEAGGEETASEDQSLAVPAAPAEVPSFVAERLGDVERDRFFVLMNLVGYERSHAVIVDQDGDLVWWATASDPTRNVVMSKPSRDGRHVWLAQFDKGALTDGGIQKIPFGAMSSADAEFTVTDEGHHDFVELPDQQTLAFLAHEYAPIQVDGHGEVMLQADVVVEVPVGSTGGGPYQLVYAMTRDYGEPWSMFCDHLVPAVFQGQLSTEWGHGNSLMYDEAEDAYFVNLRNLDQILKVPRSGGVAWRLGGPGNAFTLDDPADWFEHAHVSDMDGQGFAVFSNELHSQGSRVLVYELDQDGKTVTTTFRYDDPAGRTVQVLGDADRLPGGSVMASWGGVSTVEELGADGTVRWRATGATAAGDGVTIGRISYLPDLYAR